MLDVPKNLGYDAPGSDVLDEHGHKHDDHHHSHGVGYSKFTALLLPYTSRWPLIHAIMTEKDSRRIFYFMGYDPK